MEKFKAVEKEMKTKAYSKEGLMAVGRLDPKEREKAEAATFLTNMVDELDRQIEQLEAEADQLQAGMKKGKKDTARAERISELDEQRERHKWHQSKLELVLRTLENGGIEVEHVKAIEEDVKYYVENNREDDFVEDDSFYDDLNLQEEEDIFGMGNDGDRVSSQDTQSIAEDVDGDARPPGAAGKQKAPVIAEPSGVPARRPSAQLKSPLPALATLHQPLPIVTNGAAPTAMKPAPPPARTPGEPLKYASAAAAAAASDKNGTGIAPLPPPPSATPASTANQTTAAGLSPLPTVASLRNAPSASPSPATIPAQPTVPQSQRATKSPAPGQSAVQKNDTSIPPTPALQEKPEPPKPTEDATKAAPEQAASPEDAAQPSTPALTNGDTHSEVEEESIYHLPSSLSDLLESFEATRASALDPTQTETTQRLFAASALNQPDNADADPPRYYRPQHPFGYSPNHYPSEPLPLFDNPQLYSRLDNDTLFYLFYYRQGTYQQFLAARALKSQSWRFHKQYSTWFQRHEEPKKITDEFEQGTYRFFDYESTW
jgi:CCR4-NOT transcription complex subunit 3